MNKLRILLLTFVLGLTSACASDNGHFAVISDKPLWLYTLSAPNQIVAPQVEATSSRHAFLLIPTGRTPTLDGTIDQLIRQHQGDYLANVKIEHVSMQLMFWYQYTAWHITGDVMRVYK